MRNQFHKTLDRLGQTIAAGVDFDDETCPDGFALTVTLVRVTQGNKPGESDTHDVLAESTSRFRCLDA